MIDLGGFRFLDRDIFPKKGVPSLKRLPINMLLKIYYFSYILQNILLDKYYLEYIILRYGNRR